MNSPRIALIHATTVAIAPIEAAFAAVWPEAERMNLLDDSLSTDRAKDDDVTPALAGRFQHLAEYAKKAGAEGILYTCSAFGPAIDAVKKSIGIPTLKPNEAMFEEALNFGSRIGMLTTFSSAAKPMCAELLEMAERRGQKIELQSLSDERALAALKAGEPDLHDAFIADMAEKLSDCDAIVLGQFSMARAQRAVLQRVSVPVLTSPDCAVRALRRLVTR